MREMKYKTAGIILAASLILFAGCVEMPSTALLSAVAKYLSNPTDPPIGSFTAEELVAIAQPEFLARVGIVLPPGTEIPELTNEQAQVVVDFLDVNGLENLSDLENLDPTTLEIPDSVRDLAASFGIVID